GLLALLPLGVLPTGSAAITEAAEPPFAEYRDVPWLARTHAVTMIPSVATLRVLRQLPPNTRGRAPLIGFGDPYFSANQAVVAPDAAPVARSTSKAGADAVVPSEATPQVAA